MVSIIVPVYKAENFIEETIDTVVAQTFTDWELLLVDDRSPDHSAEVIEKKRKTLPDETAKKIHLIRKEKNEGAAKARNTGLDAAKGRYIAFLDADDLWDPQKLELSLSFMDKYQAGFVFTSYRFGDENGNPNGKVTRVPRTLNYKQALSRTVIFTSTVLLDTEKINKNLMYMPAVGSEDTATWWQILKTGVTAYGLNMPLAIYRRPAGSLSSNKGTAVKRIWWLYRNVAELSPMCAAGHMIGWAWRATVRRAIDDAVINHLESVKRFLTVQMSLIGLILQTVLYAAVWFQIYYPIISGPIISQDGYYFGNGIKLYFRGHALILIIYFLVLLFIAKSNGGLKTGYHRPMHIFGSMVISIAITNLITYAQLSLMYNWLLPAVPIIVLSLAETALSFIWSYLSDYIYRHVFPARDTLVVTGEDQTAAKHVLEDFATRQDRFRVMKTISLKDSSLDEIEEECLRWYGCVVISGVYGKIKEQLLQFCYGHYIRVYLVPQVSDLLIQGSEQMDMFSTPILELKEYSIRWENRILKRLLDIIGSLIALAVTSPVLIARCIASKKHAGERKAGERKKEITAAAERNLQKIEENEHKSKEAGNRIKANEQETEETGEKSKTDDRRKAFRMVPALGMGGKPITCHAFSDDGPFESLPKFIDVLQGRMSLVGPELLPRSFQENLIEEKSDYFYRLRVKPGITGFAQKKGMHYQQDGNADSIADNIADNIADSNENVLKTDLYYVQHYSFLLDCKILLSIGRGRQNQNKELK